MMPCMLTAPARPAFAGEVEMASGGQGPTLAGAAQQLAAWLGSYIGAIASSLCSEVVQTLVLTSDGSGRRPLAIAGLFIVWTTLEYP